jgi:hypothetical protein
MEMISLSTSMTVRCAEGRTLFSVSSPAVPEHRGSSQVTCVNDGGSGPSPRMPDLEDSGTEGAIT